ncbi:DUF134 domain-containing protein [Kiritimatiellaeota bacterium B1221]|nr:DUF134 domain-containing protein [Kiritimatiellaeota bacterium B1221]
MARPPKTRKMERLPSPVIYVPAGLTADQSSVVEVAIEDFEMMRWVDGRGYHLQEAADKMGVSKSTAGRMLERARRGIALGIERKVPLSIDAGDDLLLETSVIRKGTAKRLVKKVEGSCLAVACENVLPDSAVERMFGRTPSFVLVPEGGGVPWLVANPGFGVKKNAAKLAVELLKNNEVVKVVAGRFGPEALSLLSKNNIEVLVSGGLSLGRTLDYLQEGS